MTLAQAAEYFHVSKQGLYQRIAKEGMKPRDLQKADGQLTEQGFKWLSQRYDNRREAAEIVTPQDATIKQLKEKLAAAEARAEKYQQAAEATAAQLAKAKEAITAAEEKTAKAEAVADEARATKDKLAEKVMDLSDRVAELAQQVLYLTAPVQDQEPESEPQPEPGPEGEPAADDQAAEPVAAQWQPEPEPEIYTEPDPYQRGFLARLKYLFTGK